METATGAIREQLGRVIVGQEEVIEQLLITLFSRGHCLLEGVPGLAKTLLISTLAKTPEPGVQPHPVHARPDAGRHHRHRGDRGEPRDRRSRDAFHPGPIFANVMLADEINRTPPKTQAALLEAMQERQVTVGRIRHLISDPFFVLATQNPIEQEGTYPLPEAQQDRFMFKALVNYPSFEEEVEVARRTTTGAPAEITPVLSPEEIYSLQELVRSVPVSDHLTRYAVALVRGTRVGEPEATEFCRNSLAWGAGPRAVQYLILGGKARCLMHGRPCVAIEDIQALARPVLRHRLLLDFAAESEGVTPDAVIDDLLQQTPTHPDRLSDDPRFRGVLAS